MSSIPRLMRKPAEPRRFLGSAGEMEHIHRLSVIRDRPDVSALLYSKNPLRIQIRSQSAIGTAGEGGRSPARIASSYARRTLRHPSSLCKKAYCAGERWWIVT